MSLDDDIRLIAEAPLFADLNADQLRLLAFGAERLSFLDGQVIFRQGDLADYSCVIANGEVEALVATTDGNKTLKSLKRPAMLGQMALLTQLERAFTAVATSDVTLLRINRSLFHRMLREYPETAAAIHSELSRDLKKLLQDIGRLEARFNAASDL
ncbi:MAG: cyclic nucleotide-binding domain-containing protein [Pseudomonadota bacterium]